MSPLWNASQANTLQVWMIYYPSSTEEAVNNKILALLLYPTPQGYFGPKKLRPSTALVTKAPRKKNTERTSGIVWPSSVEEDMFLDFDPYKHVEIRHFVTMHVTPEDVLSWISFFLGRL